MQFQVYKHWGNHWWKFHCFNGVEFPNILNENLWLMHGSDDLRLVLT